MNRVSVIIPTWNRADMIEDSIRSALNQTVPPLEVLVCDDGSTDGTRDIVESIADPRVKWIEGPRGGCPAVPRNRGIAESKGEWLALLDSDDEWLPEKLAEQLALAEVLKCKALCTNALRFVPDKGIVGNFLTWEKEIITFDDLLKVNQVICSSAMIHRSLLTEIKGFPVDKNVIEDYALWLRTASLTNFAYVNKPLVIYRDDAANSVRSQVVTHYWRQRFYVFGDYLKWAAGRKLAGNYRQKVRKQLGEASWNIKKEQVLGYIRFIKRLILK